MTLIYRSVKGSPLTSSEGDSNIHDLDDRITAIEDSPPEAVSIDDITQAGDQITVLLTDSTERGPFTLPSGRPNYVGDWQPSTLYAVNDWLTANGALYAVVFAHTSDTDFDPGANDGMGHDFYQLIFELPGNVLPTGGLANQVLKKVDATNYNTFWDDSTTAPVPPVVDVPLTTFTPLSLSDGNTYYRCTHNDGCSVTIPSNETIAFPVGTELHFRQCSVGAVELAGEEDTDLSDGLVELNPEYDEDGAALDTATSRRGGVIVAKKVGTNEWDVFGACRAMSV